MGVPVTVYVRRGTVIVSVLVLPVRSTRQRVT